MWLFCVYKRTSNSLFRGFLFLFKKKYVLDSIFLFLNIHIKYIILIFGVLVDIVKTSNMLG